MKEWPAKFPLDSRAACGTMSRSSKFPPVLENEMTGTCPVCGKKVVVEDVGYDDHINPYIQMFGPAIYYVSFHDSCPGSDTRYKGEVK